MSDAGKSFRSKMEVDGDALILTLSGEVDLHSSPQLRATISEMIQNAKPRVILDLSGVPYMDSSGVGTLVEAKRLVEREEARLFLVNPQKRVMGVFEITHLDRFFTICASVEEAKQA